jgi:hypothetical protein
MAAMSAEPSEPQPDFAAPDRRLRAVEHRQEHELAQEVAATGEAARILHADLREVDRAVTRAGQRLDQVAASQQDTARALAEQAAVLATIAGRAYERVLAGHSDKLATIAGKVDVLAVIGGEHADALARQGGQVESLQRDVAGVMGLQEEQGRLLTAHGEMLAEILRRLPAGPE